MTGQAPPLARRFHDATTHTPESVRASGRTLDWDNKPFPFKIYPDLAPLPLPREIDPLAVSTLGALAGEAAPRAARLTLDALAALLYYTAGVTKKKSYPGGGEMLFRAAPSTGALYQTEVYVAAGAVDGLEPGLYHFCPGDFALRRLRAGDVRGWLAAAGADESLARRAATLVLTAIWWRNTWKYGDRGFRHLFWDAGTMLANGLAAGGALGLAPRVLAGFVDDDVNRLLGLDAGREGALALAALGPDGAPGPPPTAPPEPIAHAVVPLSRAEVDAPALRELYRVSSLADAAAVEAWRRAAPPAPRAPRGPLRSLPLFPPEAARPLGETIRRRGSTRRFDHAALTPGELGTALWAATRATPADVPSGLVDLYLVVNAVEGIPPGAYAYWPARGDVPGGGHALEQIRAGEFRARSAFLCLEQALGGEAAAVVYVLAPLDALLEAWGDRGYRLANLEAGLAGGRAYLAAYGSGFGATGLTFYDRLVVDFFSPHAAGLDAIFVTALGRAAGRAPAPLIPPPRAPR